MKVAIIGAGACGLMLATRLEKAHVSYKLFNSGKIGSKILASGNGRCNIGNTNLDSKYYHNNLLAKKIVIENKEEYFNVLKELRIYTKADEEGRLYPLSESSASVLKCLLRTIKEENIIEWQVKRIIKKNNHYYIDEYGEAFDYLVLAIGSSANKPDSKNYLELVNNLHISTKPFVPSLVGFQLLENIRSMSGARCKCKASLYSLNNELIHFEEGEAIFKDDGISGICIMNLSSYYQKMPNKKGAYIKLDLVGDKTYDDYTTVITPKILDYITKHQLNPQELCFKISKTYDLVYAQVASGGIVIEEITSNLSMKKDSSFFVGGEVIDVDGVCGGYNLMFAFCCALVIGKELINEISN